MRDKNERLVDRIVEAEEKRINTLSQRILKVRVHDKKEKKDRERVEAQVQHELDVWLAAKREFERDPLSEVPDDVKLPQDYFDDVYHKAEYNTTYANHYWQRFEDTNLEKYAKASQRILNCHKSWIGDHYKQSGFFDLKRVFHCENRWCWLCNHLKQAKRLYKYHIRFEELLKLYDLYHVVFTVPNCKGDVLKDTLSRMHNGLYKIIRYFQGYGKIKGIDFGQYGFVGAIRSFEIVINPTDYHPHIHCLFMLNKGLEFVKTEINKYSFDHGIMRRKFSEFEILLQKVFYLTFSGQKVNMNNIQNVPLGYSCIMDFVEGDSWHEVFKYATKMSKDGASACTYNQFVLLDDIFHRMKMIQGYGIFYDMDEDSPETDPTAEILFEKVLILLNQREKPEREVTFELEKLVNELHQKKITVISKKMSYKLVKAILDDLRAESNIEYGFEPF